MRSYTLQTKAANNFLLGMLKKRWTQLTEWRKKNKLGKFCGRVNFFMKKRIQKILPLLFLDTLCNRKSKEQHQASFYLSLYCTSGKYCSRSFQSSWGPHQSKTIVFSLYQKGSEEIPWCRNSQLCQLNPGLYQIRLLYSGCKPHLSY